MGRLSIFTREEIRTLLKEAADYCKQKVPVKLHKSPSGRVRLGRPKKDYLDCISAFIRAKELKRLKEKGVAVDPSFEREVMAKASKYGITV